MRRYRLPVVGREEVYNVSGAKNPIVQIGSPKISLLRSEATQPPHQPKLIGGHYADLQVWRITL